MNWNLTENGNTLVPGNFLVAAIYDPAAPTVVVQWVPLPQPYTSTKNFSFTGLVEQIYNFVLWENTTAVVGGSARNSFSLQPTENTLQTRTDLCLTAGVSVNFPVGGTSYVADAPNDLTGWPYDIERKPQGTQFEGETVAINSNGFSLMDVGDVFGPGEEWVLHFQPLAAAAAPPPVTTGIIVVPQIITGDITLDSGFTGKLGLIQGAAGHLTIVLPPLNTMANNKVIGFNSAGGSHINAILQCAGSDAILWSSGVNGRPTRVVLGQNEGVQLFKANDAGGTAVWNIVPSPSDTIRMAGEIIYEYTTVKLNTTFADGGERDWNDYARHRMYVQSLPSSQVVTEAAWDITDTYDGVSYFRNRGKYTLGDNSTFFRVPQLYNYGFLRAINPAARTAGDFEILQQLAHTHDTSTGALPGQHNGKGGLGVKGGYNGTNVLRSDLTSMQYNVPGDGLQGFQLTRIGGQNRPDNTGVYALIRT